VQESVEDDSFMNSALSFFGKAKIDKTSIKTKGHDGKIEPIFMQNEPYELRVQAKLSSVYRI